MNNKKIIIIFIILCLILILNNTKFKKLINLTFNKKIKKNKIDKSVVDNNKKINDDKIPKDTNIIIKYDNDAVEFINCLEYINFSSTYSNLFNYIFILDIFINKLNNREIGEPDDLFLFKNINHCSFYDILYIYNNTSNNYVINEILINNNLTVISEDLNTLKITYNLIKLIDSSTNYVSYFNSLSSYNNLEFNDKKKLFNDFYNNNNLNNLNNLYDLNDSDNLNNNFNNTYFVVIKNIEYCRFILLDISNYNNYNLIQLLVIILIGCISNKKPIVFINHNYSDDNTEYKEENSDENNILNYIIEIIKKNKLGISINNKKLSNNDFYQILRDFLKNYNTYYSI